jgi:hypothetical protein
MIWRELLNQLQKHKIIHSLSVTRFIVVLFILFVLSISTKNAAAQTIDSLEFSSAPDTLISTQTTLTAISDTGLQATATKDSAIAAKKKAAASKRHSPLKASLFSAALPGLGQGYNKKYWKIPIVYAGFAGLGYAVYYTASNFQGYRNAYRLQVDEDPNTIGSYKGVQDAATLKSYRDYFKRNLDISAICMSVWYVLNIVDAAVDAHLFEWNMSDDLSMRVEPILFPSFSSNYAQAGVKFGFHF